MSVKRIIPCLDVKDGRVVKGVNFVALKDIGNPVELARFYDQEGADELVFLDISKTQDGHAFLLPLIQETAAAITVPLTVGGGIKTLDDIQLLLEAGASRVSIGSAAIADPEFVKAAVEKFGGHTIVAAIDIQWDDEDQAFYVYSHGGTKRTDWKAFDWLLECEKYGVGELLITNKNRDGVQNGFDLEFLSEAAKIVDTPIIASGGAGTIEDFVDLFEKTPVTAGLAASIFHNGTVKIADLKTELMAAGIPLVPATGPDFAKGNGLISVILQDSCTQQVLMNGYMNKEAYQRTLQDNVVWFYSRSKERLWKKGETSRHYQYVDQMSLDCDRDALLVQVTPAGPTCHLNRPSCFEQDYFNLATLFQTVENKVKKPEEGSYTAYLAKEGLDKILKKCGEEMTEVVIAAKNADRDELIAETCDLIYHTFVLLAQQGVSLEDINRKLAIRHGGKTVYRIRKDIENW